MTETMRAATLSRDGVQQFRALAEQLRILSGITERLGDCTLADAQDIAHHLSLLRDALEDLDLRYWNVWYDLQLVDAPTETTDDKAK